MIRAILSQVYGSGVGWTNVRDQRGIPYLSDEELWALRGARLRQIAQQAVVAVPYGQNLFLKEDLDPKIIKTVHDRCLPLVEKSTVRKNPSLYFSASRRGTISIAFTTTGSTESPPRPILLGPVE